MQPPAEPPLPTLDRWLAIVAPRLASVLVDATAMGRLERAARHLPADCLGIVEVRLGAGDPEVDLSVRLNRPEQARWMARQVARPHPQEFLARWAEERSAAVPALWLELDLGRSEVELPPPVLCAQLAPGVDPLWLAEELLPALHGRPLGSAQRARVLRAARAVPPPARLLYAFSLLSRQREAVRLEILGLGPAEPVEMAGYLERVEGAERAAPDAAGMAATAEVLAPLLAGAEKPHLSLDFAGAGEISPRIGIEGAFARQPGREPRWRELLDRLVERGLCSPAKREAVLAWPGHDSFWTAPGWPVAPLGMGGFCVRFLSHLKVVGWPDRTPQAKAYLGFRYLPPPSRP